MTKKTIRHHIIASAAHDGEPGVIAKSQKMCAKVNSRLEPEAHSTIKLTMDLSKIHFFDIETENTVSSILYSDKFTEFNCVKRTLLFFC